MEQSDTPYAADRGTDFSFLVATDTNNLTFDITDRRAERLCNRRYKHIGRRRSLDLSYGLPSETQNGPTFSLA